MAKKTIKKTEKYLTKSKTKVVAKTSKVLAKKVVTKPSFNKHEIKAKILGKNLVIMVGGVKLVKPNIQPKELKTIDNKIKIYNKVPTKARQEEIFKFFESVSKKETDLKSTKAKGLKNVLRKAKKDNPKKTTKEEKDTLEKVVKDVAPKEVLKVVESVKEYKEQPKQAPVYGSVRKGEY